MHTETRQEEIGRATLLFGQPAYRRIVREISADGYHWWTKAAHKRYGEVVLFVRRPNGKLLLHTKETYPEHTWRLPSGTLRKGESLLTGLQREAKEETGLDLAVERFLAVVEYEFRFRDSAIPFLSYCFLLQELGGQLQVQDPSEGISGFMEASVEDLLGVAVKLESLPGKRADWGQFRAYAHRLGHELLQKQAQT